MQNPWAIEPGQGVGDWRLGASRDDVLRRLAERGIKSESEIDDGDLLIVDDLEVELKFGRSQRLCEITAESERLTLAGHAVIGARLHEVVDRLRVDDSETLWTLEEQGDEEELDAVAAKPPTDEELISEGSLWIPRLGLGFDLWRGEVLCVRMRQPADVPPSGVGALTPSQRRLLAKPDLSNSLTDEDSTPKRPPNRYQQVLTIALMGAMGWLIWTAIDYQRKWSASPSVEGEVIAVEPPPPEPFPSEFTVAYHVDGKEHRTVFGVADVYMTRAVGDKVDVRYLPDAPDQPMGPARVNDAAFLRFMPWGIGIFGAYLALQLLISIGSKLLPATARPEELKTTLGTQYD
ncbi:MAG TPA: DUF3592 domain-containing protein [Pirellulaceae bacterium]|jgi:hypothetical protein|nr:DUF3592 domain-containing protein [Pirellulaceae bacterium]